MGLSTLPPLPTLICSTQRLNLTFGEDHERMLYQGDTYTQIFMSILQMDLASVLPASTRSPAAVPAHLVDAEMALEPAAIPIIERYLHRVVNMTHFVPSHLILDV